MTEFPLRRRTYLMLSAGALASAAGCQDGIEGPPEFEITSVSAPEDATQGETITVSATVTNTGGREGDGEVTLAFSDFDSTTESFSLDEGESHDVTVDHEVSESDDLTVKVETDGEASAITDSATETVAVSVDVDALDLSLDDLSVAPSTAAPGESFTVSASVTNDGDASAFVDAELWRGSSATAAVTESVALDAGEQGTVDLEYDIDDPGSHSLEVRLTHDGAGSALDSGSVDVSILEPDAADFEIDYLRVSNSLVVDDREFVSVNVVNEGQEAGTASVELEIDGTTVATETAELDDDGSHVLSEPYRFDELGSVSVEVTVSDENGAIHDTASDSVDVTEPEGAWFAVDIASAPTTALLGEDAVEIEASVTNRGDEPGSTTADLQFDGDVVDTASTGELAADETATVDLGAVVEGEERAVQVAVDVDGGSDSVSIDALEPTPTNFLIERVEAPGEETVSVAWQAIVTVANAGQSTGLATPTLTVQDSVADEAEVEIPGGEERTTTLEFDAPEPGEYEFAIETADDDRLGAVTILDAQHPEVTLRDARDRLAAVAADQIGTIESDFAAIQTGGYDRGSVVARLDDVENRLEGAAADIDQFESDGRIGSAEADELRDERAELEATAAALRLLADSMDDFATAIARYDEAAAAADAGDVDTGIAALTGDDGLTDALSLARANRDGASSGLDDVDAAWLRSFDDDVSAATAVDDAVDDAYGDAIDSFEAATADIRRDLAAVALADARDALAAAVADVGEQLDSEFGSEPWAGVSLSTTAIDELAVDRRLSDVDDAVGDVDTSGTDVGRDREQLERLTSAVEGLGEGMESADTAITRATDAASVIGMSESAYRSARDAIQNDASPAIDDARAAFDAADGDRAALDGAWVSGDFDPAVDGYTLAGVFGSFEVALDATEVLVDGMESLIDSGPNVVAANRDYDRGTSAYSDGNYGAAAASFDDAASEFRAAESTADGARDDMAAGASDLPGDLGLMLEVAICKADHFSQAAGLFVDAAELAADAADAAGDGDSDRADDLMDDAESKGQDALSTAESSCP